MIEVEAKARIKNPEKYKKMALEIGRYCGKENKKDDYYTLEDLGHYPEKSLRIRKRRGFFEVNFKQKIHFAKGVHAKYENEFKLSKIDDFLALVNDFGFRKWLKKEKISYIYEINKNFHIELNKIKNLGWFLEVEYLCSKEKDISKASKSVLGVMKKFGIGRKEIIGKGYTKMLWDKSH